MKTVFTSPTRVKPDTKFKAKLKIEYGVTAPEIKQDAHCINIFFVRGQKIVEDWTFHRKLSGNSKRLWAWVEKKVQSLAKEKMEDIKAGGPKNLPARLEIRKLGWSL